MHRYTGDGTIDGGQQVVEAIANDDLFDASVAVNSEGWAVVAWDDDQDGTKTLTFCKLIDPEGQIQTSDVEVPSDVLDNTDVGDIAINDEGRFCVEFEQANSAFQSPDAVHIACLWADMEPAFGGPYQFTVPLGSPAGTFVGVVQAIDSDGEETSYSLADSGAFAIDPTTGEITVADPATLRSTAATSYTLTVQADDGYALANVRPATNVLIMIDDPTPPQITPMPNWTVDAGETVVPVIQASDPAGCVLTYSAAIGNNAPATAIVNGADLMVTPAAGYTGTFPVRVTATNGIRSTTATFQVAIVTPTLNSVPDLKTRGPASVNLAGSDSSGTALTYSAAITGSGAGPAPATLSIENNVLSITPSPGYVGTFTVTAAVSDGPDMASQSFRVTVTPVRTPTISWANPADMVAGTPLSALQLDATASVPGTFTYTPPAGTILSAGAGQVLTATFTPTDTIDYSTATAIARINVNPPPLVTVTSVQAESVHLTKRKTATDIVITFSGGLDSADADILGNYHLAAPGKGKKSKTYTKLIHLNSAVYGRTQNVLTLQLNGKLSVTPAPQLRITAANIHDAYGRAMDGNHDGQAGGDFVALLTNRGAQPQLMSRAVAFARRSPQFMTRP